MARLATKPTPFSYPQACLIDRPTATAFYSADEVADWMAAQAKARGFKSNLLDRFLKAVKIMSLERRRAEPDTTGDAVVTNAQRIAARRRIVEAQEAEARRFEAASRRRTTTGKSSLETFRVRAARLRAVGRQSAGRRS